MLYREFHFDKRTTPAGTDSKGKVFIHYQTFVYMKRFVYVYLSMELRTYM